MKQSKIITNRIKRILSGIVLTFVLILIVGSLFIGCTQRSQYKGWLSVEKSPVRVIIVDSEKDIDQQFALDVIDAVALVPYNEAKFNKTTEIGVSTDYSLKYKDTVERNANIKVKK